MVAQVRGGLLVHAPETDVLGPDPLVAGNTTLFDQALHDLADDLGLTIGEYFATLERERGRMFRRWQ